MKKKVSPAKRKGTTALVKKETGLPATIRPDGSLDFQSLIAIAMKSDPPSVERLLAMSREMKAERAKESYFEALAGFQSECPIVFKTKKVKGRAKDGKPAEDKYSYAPFEDILAFHEEGGPTVKELLRKWGFSYTFKSQQTDKTYTAICYGHHRDGHSEYTEFTVPTSFPEYMNMSGAQEQGASCTYADRYAFKNQWGIVTKGEDKDAVREDEGDQKRRPIQAPQEKGPIIYPRADGTASDAVPVHHEVKVELSDYEKGLKYLTATETDPKSKVVVGLFTENEKVDYTHELGEAKDNPEGLAKIIADIIETGKKRRAAVKGEK